MNFFTPAERIQTLDTLLDAFSSDPRLAGLLVVGSGATGFTDRFSDIDLSVILPEPAQVRPVLEDWVLRLDELLPVAHHFWSRRGAEIYFYGALLTSNLELDISFLAVEDLYARRPAWSVVFDRLGGIEEKMQASWAECRAVNVEAHYLERLDSIWHYILPIPVLLARGRTWRALYYLDMLRVRTVELAGLRWVLETDNYRQVDDLPPEFTAELADTLVGEPKREGILRALQAATGLFFIQARALDRQLGLDASEDLAVRMENYLRDFKV